MNKLKFKVVLILIVMISLVSTGCFGTSQFNTQGDNLEEDDLDNEVLASSTEEKNKVSKNVKQDSFISIAYDSYKEWEELLKRYSYDINQEVAEVPRVKVEKFPEDMGEIIDVAKKKKIFLSIILIGAYHANRELIEDRLRLKAIVDRYSKSSSIKAEDEEWLSQMKKEYGVKSDNLEESLKSLLVRVDIIPLSLVLAQAACESGWGTSRFTKVANNIFGEWTFSQEVAGVVPKDRPVNASYKIRKFTTVEASIKSYIDNLNSHYAYEELWKIRKNLRDKNKKIDSLKLAEGLLNYSQRKELYIEEIQDIIKYNKLQRLDTLLEY